MKKSIKMKLPGILSIIVIIVLTAPALSSCKLIHQKKRADKNREADRIKPWSENTRYWQYKGEPVMLLGGTDQDNLFNHPNMEPDGLEAHLDLLVSVGGNYVRNTMSSRDRKDSTSIYFNDNNIYPFQLDQESGLYDLEKFNESYWYRLEQFLDMTARRDVIVQMEIWDRWDYSGDRQPNYLAFGWSENPYNPKNNINYSAEETGLDTMQWYGHPIFRTIPELDSVPVVLSYQEKFADKLLSITLKYDHILYCISNESDATEEWSRYWATFIRDRAKNKGINIEVTEMWNHWDLSNSAHKRTFDNPGLYSFTDISQNNHQPGQIHWNNMQSARELITNPPRPMNNVKIYGGDIHGGGLTEGADKFWRNILGGCASARFHRPGKVPGYYGAGLSELAQTQIRSAGMFLESFDIFMSKPDPESFLLTNREENEAYLSFIPDSQYAIYFPDGGSAGLDPGIEQERIFSLQWLDITNSKWSDEIVVRAEGTIEVTTPGRGQWIALIK